MVRLTSIQFTGHNPFKAEVLHQRERSASTDSIVTPRKVSLGFIKGHIATDADKANYIAQIKNWVMAAGEDIRERGKREQASEKIQNWIKRHNYGPASQPLNLSHLLLTDLPPLPSGVRDLDISYNQLEKLPEQLPPRLKHFDANNNLLKQVGDFPTTLKTLNLSHNPFLALAPANLHLLQKNCVVVLDFKLCEIAFQKFFRSGEVRLRNTGPKELYHPKKDDLPAYSTALHMLRPVSLRSETSYKDKLPTYSAALQISNRLTSPERETCLPSSSSNLPFGHQCRISSISYRL